jgi:hypothetical protein
MKDRLVFGLVMFAISWLPGCQNEPPCCPLATETLSEVGSWRTEDVTGEVEACDIGGDVVPARVISVKVCIMELTSDATNRKLETKVAINGEVAQNNSPWGYLVFPSVLGTWDKTLDDDVVLIKEEQRMWLYDGHGHEDYDIAIECKVLVCFCPDGTPSSVTFRQKNTAQFDVGQAAATLRKRLEAEECAAYRVPIEDSLKILSRYDCDGVWRCKFEARF